GPSQPALGACVNPRLDLDRIHTDTLHGPHERSAIMASGGVRPHDSRQIRPLETAKSMHTTDDTPGREEPELTPEELAELRAKMAERGLMASGYDRPAPARQGWDARGTETAVGPWRRTGDIIEAAAPLASGPTRYRVLERVERRHRWREPEQRAERERFVGWPPELVQEYLAHPTYIDWHEVGRLDEEERARLMPYLFARRLEADELELLP